MKISLSIPLNLLAEGWATYDKDNSNNIVKFAHARNFWTNSELEMEFCIGVYFGEGK